MTSGATPSNPPMRAGGRATEAGMAFQADVGTWFAAHALAGIPVGGRFGIGNQAIPVAIRLETGEGLDDVEVTMSDGGSIHLQCKTSANLSPDVAAPLGKTLGQLAIWVADAKLAGRTSDPTRTAAVLAVQSDASGSLNRLEAGCRAFDLGGTWTTTRSQRNTGEQDALAIFETVTSTKWADRRGKPPEDADLVDMARVFHIARFAMDEGATDWREASHLLGQGLFGGSAAGNAPLRDLKDIVRTLIASGAPADRAGLLQALRRLGHRDVGSPGFDAEIARVRAATTSELARLRLHTLLPLGEGIPLARDVDEPLRAAMAGDPVLVIGEPGAGKTGALVSAALGLQAGGQEVVFLSVDQFPGVAIAPDLASSLGLTRSVLEVLAAWPGAGRKVLVIDALDAARGGPSETVFASLIESVLAQLSADWSVVASIRTFDLRNGRRFRLAFTGAAADPSYADGSLRDVRHFVVPCLSPADIARVGAASDQLAGLTASAPRRLNDLLANIFNLSLAAQLLADGVDPAGFSSIGTQSGLIDAYEDRRLATSPLQQAAKAAAESMATRLRLTVRKVTIPHSELDEVIRRGVLVQSGDLVSFAHHVLFDHVVGRFHLEWDDPRALLAQLAGDTSTALLLAPALRFAVERLWRNDGEGRPLSWQLALGIFSATSVDPVLGNVALRASADSVEYESDMGALVTLVTATSVSLPLITLLGRLTQFAAISIKAADPLPACVALAWARLAEVLVATRSRALLQSAHNLLFALFGREDLTDQNAAAAFGRASRDFLSFAWSCNPPLPAANLIRFVGKSFASDPAASRGLLDRTLREPHFSAYADQEVGWLAEQVVPITRADPDFTVEIYSALYSQSISDQATTFIGGQASRIMPLMTNRKQDFEHCRWRLGVELGEILRIAPDQGTRAVIEANIGLGAASSYGVIREPELVALPAGQLELRPGGYEFQTWDPPPGGGNRDDDPLHRLVIFLRACDVPAFSASVAAASRGYASTAVWVRIFGVGSERAAEVDRLLWPLLQTPDFLRIPRIAREAYRFMAAVWDMHTVAERTAVENMIVAEARLQAADMQPTWLRGLAALFSAVPEYALELEETRALHRDSVAERRPPEANVEDINGFRNDAVDLVRETLRRDQVDTGTGPTNEILAASDALYDQTQRTPTESAAPALASLWQTATALVTLLEANTGLHHDLDLSAWGHVANAVERVASSANFEPGRDGLPELEDLFGILDTLTASRYPESGEA